MAMSVLACRRRAPTLLHLVHGRVAILACAGDGWVDSKLGPLQSTVRWIALSSDERGRGQRQARNSRALSGQRAASDAFLAGPG